MTILQAMEKCGPEGRDCIERHSTLDFNCSVTCEGIFADTVHLAVDTTEEKARGSFGQNGAELDNKKFKKLVSEYKNFKKKNCRHFRFNSAANATKFGKFESKTIPNENSGEELPESTLQLVQIYFDTATFDEVERDKKIKTEAQLSLIGGTMGLLTGFSIISGVEIVFFLFKLISSIKIPKCEKKTKKKTQVLK